MALVLCVAAGCGGGGPSAEEITTHFRAQQAAFGAPLTLQRTEILSAEETGDPPLWQVQVRLIVTPDEEMFDPVSLQDAYAEAQYDPGEYDRAFERMQRLLEPERQRTVAQQPEPLDIGGLYRRTLPAGEEFSITTTIKAQRNDDAWVFTGDLSDVQLENVTAQTLPRSELPSGAVVLDESADNPLRRHIEAQREFIAAVAAAEKALAARLARQHDVLAGMAESPAAWIASLPIPNSPDLKLRLRFVHRAEDGARSYLLAENADDEHARAMWIGALELQQAGGGNLVLPGELPQGWLFVCGPANRDETYPENVNRLVLACNEQDEIVLTYGQTAVPLVEDSDAVPLPPYADYVAQLRARLAPGNVWEGTLKYEGGTALSVRLIAADFQEEQNYFRLIIERLDDPLGAVIFHGALDTSPENAYTWPVRLWHAKVDGFFDIKIGFPWPLLSLEMGNSLNLSFSAEGELLAAGRVCGNLRVKSVAAIDPFAIGPARWRDALTVGAYWTGKIMRGNDPAKPLALRVLEVAEEGRIYVLAFYNPEDPHQYRVFRASLDGEGALVDCFGLAATAVSPVAHKEFVNGSNNALFHPQNCTLGFRLSPEGQTLHAFASYLYGETIELTLDDDQPPPPLSRAEVVEAWQAACTAGRRWTGLLTNDAAGQSAPIELSVTSGLDALGNVEVQTRLAADGPAIRFRGRLDLDGEAPFGFALQLQKQDAGQGPSVVFGGETRNISLFLRLNDAGDGFYGMAGYAPDNWLETVELAPAAAEEAEAEE